VGGVIEVTVDSLAAQQFLRGVRPKLLARLVPAVAVVELPARYRIFTEGGYAGKFWLIRSGEVKLGLDVPGHGVVVVEALGLGDVLGWSWLIPPHQWSLSAITAQPAELLEFDGSAVRAAFDDDPLLGYEITRRFVAVMARRLRATRRRIIDELLSVS
jgi:CRP/FNR family transcriptional regulator, cyclic AMP receptor protein